MTQDSPQEKEDAAWVTIDTPFNEGELREFLADVERLYRINPMLEFSNWQQLGDNQYRMAGKNLSNGQQFDTDLVVKTAHDCIIVHYSSGLKTSTTFRAETGGEDPAKLIITDDYSGTPLAEREKRVAEVDTSLTQWGMGLHRYMHRWTRWGWVPGWKYYMRRFWQPMKPMARRITFILLVVMAVEFLFFLLVFAIFRLELDKYIG